MGYSTKSDFFQPQCPVFQSQGSVKLPHGNHRARCNALNAWLQANTRVALYESPELQLPHAADHA